MFLLLVVYSASLLCGFNFYLHIIPSLSPLPPLLTSPQCSKFRTRVLRVRGMTPYQLHYLFLFTLFPLSCYTLLGKDRSAPPPPTPPAAAFTPSLPSVTSPAPDSMAVTPSMVREARMEAPRRINGHGGVAKMTRLLYPAMTALKVLGRKEQQYTKRGPMEGSGGVGKR